MNSNYMFAFNRRMQMGPGPAARSLDTGHKSLDAGHKSLDAGHKSLDAGHKSLDAGHKSLDAGHKSLDAGHKSLGPAGDRFSINRLIHYKSAGGCRSCN